MDRVTLIKALIQANRPLFAKTGSVKKLRDSHEGHEHGQLYYLVYREKGEQLKLCLGPSEESATEVKDLLQSIRAEAQFWREFDKLKRLIRKAAREARREAKTTARRH